MKKIYLFLIFLIIFSFLTQKVEAGTNDNVSGWAWSENIGWISFNCTNLGTCGIVNYGVNIDSSTGVFSGYAWSENIGWITFNEADLAGCPVSPCRAWYDFPTKKVYGWARALTDGGGWPGWIRLRDTNYGVWLDTSVSPYEFRDFVWSDMVIGWISFNCKNTGVCTTSNYKVVVSPTLLNRVPEVTATSEIRNSCAWGTTPQVAPGLSVTLSWIYSDPDGDPQAAYEIWLDNSPSFSDPKLNHLVDPSSASSYVLDLSQDDNHDWLTTLNWNTTYYWKVRVKDSMGNWSDWSNLDNFTTPAHAYPYPDFSWNPTSPSVNELTQFTDKSECYNAAGLIVPCSSWYWTFQDGDPATSNLENPKTKLTSPGTKQVTLTVADSIGSCTDSKTVNIGYPLPKWKEIPPR